MTTKSKVALAMISKGDENPEHLKRCLNSIARYVNGIFITVTTPDKGIKEVAKEYGAFIDLQPFKFHHTITKEECKQMEDLLGYKPMVEPGEKIFLFNEARNHNYAQIPEEYDWILWIDVDDIFRGGEKLRELMWVAENNQPQPADAVFINYLYQVELEGNKIKNILIEHQRERLTRNNGAYEWVAPIHETLIEQRPTVKIMTDLCDVVHLSNVDRMSNAIHRNIKTLEFSILQTEAKDPRPIYYLGKAYFDLGSKEDLEKAEKMFKAYLFGTSEHGGDNRSGWPEERSQCWSYLAEIYRRREERNNALKAGMNALIESPKSPATYLDVALSFLLGNRWEDAILWVKLASGVPQPRSTLVVNPKEQQARSLEILYIASLNLSQLDQAKAAAYKLFELYPENPEMQKRIDFINDLFERREATMAVVGLSQYLRKYGESSKLKPLLAAAPNMVMNNPFIANLQKEIFPPRKWGEKEVAIYCGPGFTNWSPQALADPTKGFVGGSEEAVIYLSKELTDLGWKVTVFGDPGEDEGDFEGVTFLPYYKFNSQDEYNILVGWRRPVFVDANHKAKKTFIWMHDIANPLDFTEERVSKMDKVIVLSPWHRTNIEKVPKEKVMISSNGIVV